MIQLHISSKTLKFQTTVVIESRDINTWIEYCQLNNFAIELRVIL
jgi:hypothetical protein